ncbi:hypothetical protein ABZ942_41075 [Nocardia sp. NPDC046473]|uniref:hypothetical protein n=1 Tax=Nocardia sp. NPDC046473 TaxID=3155733 RepID=UPI0033C2E997
MAKTLEPTDKLDAEYSVNGPEGNVFDCAAAGLADSQDAYGDVRHLTSTGLVEPDA